MAKNTPRNRRERRAATATRRPAAAEDRYWRTRLVLEYVRLGAEIGLRAAGEAARTFWIR